MLPGVPMLLLTALAALLSVYLFMPSLWLSIMAIDDSLDAHESGLAVVASRNPFRESGPPACMAKLIMLRHKIHQTNTRKRRSVSHVPHVRQTPRSYSLSPTRPKASWMRFGRAFGKQHH